MADICPHWVRLPMISNWESILKELFYDFFCLVVDSRKRLECERGYIDGIHCPPLVGANIHQCNSSNPECRKHQRLVRQLLQATRNRTFEIEVLMLPDCCSVTSIKGILDHKEYILLEKWSVKCIDSITEESIEIPELLRAVRSFIHFSQISSWFSLTKGKSPSNIYYWVKATNEPSAQFECVPETHYFPICKIVDRLYSTVKVSYPKRINFIPIIPCSKHPPLQSLMVRTISNDSSFSSNFLSPQVVKQLQKTSDNKEAISTPKCCSTDSESMFISQPSILKARTFNISDVNKAIEVRKYSNSQIGAQNDSESTSNFFCQFQMNEKSEISSRASLSKCASQENSSLSMNTNFTCFSIEESEQNKNLIPSIINSTEIKVTEQTPTKCFDPSLNFSSSLLTISKSANLLLHNSLISHDATSELNQLPNVESYKRKLTESAVTELFIPNKKRPTLLNGDRQNTINVKMNIIDEFAQSCPSKETSSMNVIHTDFENNAAKDRKNKFNLAFRNVTSQMVQKLKVNKSVDFQISQSVAKISEGEISINILPVTQSQNQTSQISLLNESCVEDYSKIGRSDHLYKKSDLQKTSLAKSPNAINNILSSSMPNSTSSFSECSKQGDKVLKKRNSRAFLKSKISTNLKRIDFSKNSKRLSSYSSNEEKEAEFDISSVSSNMNTTVEKISCQQTESSNQMVAKYKGIKTNYVRKRLQRNFNKKRIVQFRKIANDAIEDSNSTKYLENDKFMIFQSFKSLRYVDNCSLTSSSCSEKIISPKKNYSKLNIHGKEIEGISTSIPCSDQSCSIYKSWRPDLLDSVSPHKEKTYDHFPRSLRVHKRRKLLGNFEESILKGCLIPVRTVEGFRVEIGACGSFCPNHKTMPANVSFYELDSPCSGIAPYMAHATLSEEYYLPKKGAVQVTLFNPSETVVKMFLLSYDLSEMPALSETFIRQKTYNMPVGSTEKCPESQKWLRFILHLRFASSKTTKIFLYKELKIVVINRSNDDAASEFSQEPHELRSFLHIPMNPTYSNL